MAKPIDDLKSRDLKDWQRGMLDRTIVSRFNLQMDQLVNASDLKIVINGMPVCPECGGWTYPHRVKLADGNIMYFPQCQKSEEKDHGFGKFSRHGTQAPMGRKSGSRNKGGGPTQEPAVKEPRKAVEEVKLPTGKVYHDRFADILRLYQAGERAFMLKGPAGSGKSSIAMDLAECLKVPFFAVQGSGNTDESDISYFRNPHDGSVKVAPGMLGATQGPCVYLIDEGDAIPPNVLIALNMPLANRKVPVDGELRDIHPDAVFILTGNAVNGGSRQYTGRFPIDAATRDRFFEVFCDYCAAIDEVVCPDADIRNGVDRIRVRVNNDPNLSKVIMPGARLLKRCYTTSLAYNLTAYEAIKKTVEMSFDPDTASQILG